MGPFKWQLYLSKVKHQNDTRIGISLLDLPATFSKVVAKIDIILRQLPRNRDGAITFTKSKPSHQWIMPRTWSMIQSLKEISTEIQLSYIGIYDDNDEKMVDYMNMHKSEYVAIDPLPISNYEWKLTTLNKTNIDNTSSPIFELQGFKWCLKCVGNNDNDDIKLMLLLMEMPSNISKVKIRRELYLKEAEISEFKMVE